MQDLNKEQFAQSGPYANPMAKPGSVLLEDLDIAIEHLQADLSNLHDRLAPVLGPEAPLSLSTDEPQLQSPLRSRLDRLHSLHHGLVQLTERIDL